MALTSTSKSSLSDQTDCNMPIHILYNPPNQHPRGAEVVFFHDIQWSEYERSSVQTWKSSSTPSECWPEFWLSKQMPSARMSSVQYDAVIWKTNTAGHMTLYQIAENLGQDILDIYLENFVENCPVFLVGHGLGGLIIKKVIQVMDSIRSSLDGCVTSSYVSREGRCGERRSHFLNNVRGVFYYNTSHLGSRLADHTTNYRHGNPLLEIIKTLSAEASQLNDWFTKWRRSHGCRTSTIYAALQTKLVLLGGNSLMYVVEEASARADGDDFYTCQCDHFSICKPCDKTDPRYKRLVQFILVEGRHPIAVGPQAKIEDGLVELSLGGERQPRKVEPDAQIENSAEISKLVLQISSSVMKRRQGDGIYLKIDDLEKIRKVPREWDALMVSLKKARLTQGYVRGKCMLWKPLHDEDLSTEQD